MKKLLLLFTFVLFIPNDASSQIDEDQLGAWYMYFWNTQFNESDFGIQGDVQYRDWKIVGDLQQFIVRGGLNYKLDSGFKFVAGYAHFSSGEFGPSKATGSEHRIFEDINYPHRLGTRIFVNHRIRLEQRWIDNQDFRTRYRYGVFLKIPLNQPNLNKNSLYLSISDEVFINGEKNIGNNISVDRFDRNWLFAALGYAVMENLKIELGLLNQNTRNFNNNQLQLGIHHSF